ncbi:hypothetical protein ABVT39_011067 [Epinephelus coioides]
MAFAWNKVSTKTVEAARITDIEFHSERSKERARRKKRRTLRPVPKATPAQEKQLLEILAATHELPVVLSMYDDYSEPFIPKPWFKNLDNFTDEQVFQVEGETKKQAANGAWHQHRVGRITGSSAHK